VSRVNYEFFRLGLTDQESNDLVEYLKSLPDENR